MSGQSLPSQQDSKVLAGNLDTVQVQMPFLQRARQDLTALRQNHADRYFFKDTTNNVLTALEQAIRRAEEDKHDQDLHLSYKNFYTALCEISWVDGVSDILAATIKGITHGRVQAPRPRPAPVVALAPPLPASAPISGAHWVQENNQLREEKKALVQKVGELQALNGGLTVLLEQNRVQHAAIMAELKRQHQESMQSLARREDGLIKAAVKEAVKEKETTIQTLKEIIQEKDAYIALLKSGKEKKKTLRGGRGKPRKTSFF